MVLSNNQKTFKKTRIYLSVWFTTVAIASTIHLVNGSGSFMIPMNLLLSSVGYISSLFQKYDNLRLGSCVSHAIVGVALSIYGIVDRVNNPDSDSSDLGDDHHHAHNYDSTISIGYMIMTVVAIPIFWKHYTSSKALKNELNQTSTQKTEIV